MKIGEYKLKGISGYKSTRIIVLNIEGDMVTYTYKDEYKERFMFFTNLAKDYEYVRGSDDSVAV